MARVRNGQVPTWGTSRCLLVELAAQQHLLHAGQVLGQIMRSVVRLILAHPERYNFVRAQLEALDKMGVLPRIARSALRHGA